jgi:hypothetical protein
MSAAAVDLVPTIAELEPDMYRAWRRYAQEQCLLYERFPSVHHCWLRREEVHSMVNHLTGRHLYGCLRCMRAHVCLPEYKYATCPRIVNADSDEGALVCPFSGERIDDGQPAAVFNGSFDLREDMVARMEDFRRLKRAHGNGDDDDDTMGIINAHRGNSLGYAWHLRRGASDAKDTRTSRTMYRQADVAEERARRKPLIKAALRSAAGPGRARSKKRLLDDHEAAADLGLLAPSEEAVVKETEVEEDDPLAMPGLLPCIVLPPHDMVADDAYLKDVLAPLSARIASARLAPAFATASAATPAPARTPPLLPRPLSLRQVPRALAAPGPRSGCAGGDQDWTGLSPTQDEKTLVQHQRHLLLYVARFLAYYGPLLPQGAPPPAPIKHYAVFCDRLLWLYHRYVGETAHQLAPDVYWRGDRIDGGSHRLWPDGERTRRIFYALLTRVLTSDMTARDKVTDAKVFVWLRDPFLTACWRAGLFDALPPIGAELIGRGETAHSAPGLDKLRDNLLDAVRVACDATAFSPHALHEFFHPQGALLHGDSAPV